MEIKLNYSLTEEDIDTFVESLYKYSKYDKRQKIRVILLAVVGPILITVLVDKFSPGVPALIIGGFFLMYKTGLDDIKRDNKKAVYKNKNGFGKSKLFSQKTIKVSLLMSKRKK